MYSPELTPRTARRERKKTARHDFLTSAHEELFVLLTTLRGAGAEALHALHFAEHPHGGSSMRATYRWLSALEDAGLLERQFIHASRSLFRMTHRALASSPRITRRATDTFRRPMPPSVAGYAWLRAALWAEMKNRGYRVGRGRDELRAIRRFLVDTQRREIASLSGTDRSDAQSVLEDLRALPAITPLFRSYCGGCGARGPIGRVLSACAKCGRATTQVASELRFECGECGYVSDADEAEHADAKDRRRRCTTALRETDHLAFDVAWRDGPGGTEAVILFVDDPTRALHEQLDALPIRIAGQPRVPLLLRTTDEHSVYDSAAATWAVTGPRHRELLRAFSPDGSRNLFRFSTTTTMTEVRPELQLRVRSSSSRRPE